MNDLEEGLAIEEIANNIGQDLLGPYLRRRLSFFRMLNVEDSITSRLAKEISDEIDKDIIDTLMGRK